MFRSRVLRVIYSVAALFALLVVPAAAGPLPPAPAFSHPPALVQPQQAPRARPGAAPQMPREARSQPDATAVDAEAPALVRPWQQTPRIVLPPGAAAAGIGASPTITVYVTSSWIEGVTTPNADVELTFTQGATTAGRSRMRADAAGYFEVAAMTVGGRRLALQPGMTVTAKANAATVATLTLPTLTGAVDPGANTVTGQLTGVGAPATLLVQTAGVSKEVTTNGSGAFTAGFSGLAELLWWDGALVAWQSGGNWLAWTVYPRGGIVTIPVYDEVDGCSEPGQTVSVTVQHGGQSVTKEATGSAPGGCWYVGFDAIDPGDRVTANFGGHTVTQTVAAVSGSVDLATDTITVAGPPQAAVSVGHIDLFQGLTTGYLWRFGTTNAGGALAVQFPAGMLNRFVWPDIAFADGPRSDTLGTALVQRVEADWGGERAAGYVAPGAAVTATLLRNGAALETQTVNANAEFGRFVANFEARFQEGDKVRVQAGSIDITLDLVPMWLDFNRATDALEISGPANSLYSPRLYTEGISRAWRRWVNGGAGSVTSVPLAGTLDLRNGAWGALFRSQTGDPDSLGWTRKNGYAPELAVNETWDALYGRLTRPFTRFDAEMNAPLGFGSGETDRWHSLPWTNFGFEGGQANIQPGSSVKVTWGGRQETITALGMSARVDAATERVTGKAPPNSYVRVTERDAWNQLIAPTDAAGAFTADFTGIADLRPGNEVSVEAWASDWNRTEIIARANFARVDFNTDFFAAGLEPGEQVAWAVDDAAGARKFAGTGVTPSWGWFDQQCDCDIVPGDTVSVSTDRGFSAVLKPLPMTIRADPDTDKITGKIVHPPLPTQVQIWAGSAAREDGRELWTPVAADGSFTADFGAEGWDIRPGDDGEAFMNDANGNQVGLHWWTGRMDVFYTDDSFWMEGTPTAPFTVTVQGKAIFHGQVNRRGYYATWEDGTYAWNPAQPDIQPGDVVVLEQDGITKRLDPFLDIPMNIDRTADTVSGVIAEPGRDRIGQVSCSARNPDGWLQASYNGTTGVYFCDFKAAGLDLTSRTDLEVRYRDPDGDVAVNKKDHPWARANITWDSVGGWYGPGVTMNFVVQSATGAFKADGSTVTREDGWANDVWVGDRTDLIPGDRAHVWTNNGFDAWLTLVDITGRIDVGANVIRGEVKGVPLPASGWVGFNRPATEESIWQGWQSDASGRFTADLNPYDAQVGDESEVWYSDANGNTPGAWLPTLRTEVNANDDWVVIYTGASQQFTVTVQSAAGQVKGELRGVTDKYGVMRSYAEEWQGKWTPAQPDIRPGDRVNFMAYGYSKQVHPVPDIHWRADVGADRITGQVFAPGETARVRAWCSVWVEGGATVDAQPRWVDPNGGAFTCDFRAVGYDLKAGQYAAAAIRTGQSDDIYASGGVVGNRLYLPMLRR